MRRSIKVAGCKYPQDAIPKMAEDAMKIQRLLKNNPRTINLQDAIDYISAAY
jgi:alcohol dehydrogenase class IV